MALVLDNAGRIVVGGYTSTHGSYDFAVVRYEATGTLDGTFGSQGKVVFPDFGPDLGQGSDYAYAVAVQPADPEHPELPDYYVVLAGEAAGTGGAADFGLVRCDQAGNHDTSFGGAEYQGLVTTDFGGIYDAAWGVAIGQDGKIVAVGTADTGTDTNYDFGLVRYNFDGSLDDGGPNDSTPGDTFGTDGMVRTDVGQQANIAFDVVLDAEQRIVLAGFANASAGYNRDFAAARYLYSPPDIEITGFSVNPSDSTLLDVTYEIHYAQPDAFDIAIYAWFDPQTPETLLIDHFAVSDPADRTPGVPHTLSIPAVFRNQGTVEDPVYDLELDYFLMAKVDSQDVVVETNELNNTRLFDGGIFRDPGTPEEPHKIVHAHGFDRADQAARDIAILDFDAQKYYLDLYDPAGYGQQPPIPIQSAEFAKTLVSQFHIRTHDGNDDVTTPGAGDYYQFSGIEVPMWVFGGDGDDAIVGGDAQDPEDPPEEWDIDVLPVIRDRLYGGLGDDEIFGGLGPDAIYGQEDNDILAGGASRDWIHGGLGNDRIEGWSDEGPYWGDVYWGDFLWGDEGADIISGGLDDSVGLDGVDVIYGGPGDDRIDGWRGDDDIWGDRHPTDPLYSQGDGNDEIYGGDGVDEIYGGGGHDNLFGEGDYDYVYGEEGDDLLYGSPGDDWVEDWPWSGTNFFLETQPWPDALPWPELNLVADVTADVIVDDGGPQWDSKWSYQPPPEEPEPPRPGYWFVDDQSAAFGGAQSYLYAHDLEPGDDQGEDPPDPLGDAFGDGRCESVWYLPVWTEQGDVYVTWDPRPDATTAAPFVVRTMGGQLLPPSPITLDQTKGPDEQEGKEWLQIGDQKYTKLGTFNVSDGWLVVNLSDLGVPVGACIVADAVLVRPVQAQQGSENLPGSFANREENGFYGGLLLQMEDPNSNWRNIDVRIEGLIDPQTQQSRLAGRSVKVDWEGDGTVIEVYIYDDEAQGYVRINPGKSWVIGGPHEITEIWVKGAGAGTTELVFSLVPIDPDPLAGLRPISDILVVNVNA